MGRSCSCIGGGQKRGVGGCTHPNCPSGYESLKNENRVIILIKYTVLFEKIYVVYIYIYIKFC